jgi:RNA polymerase sigma-70 factor (ECF subfamily)
VLRCGLGVPSLTLDEAAWLPDDAVEPVLELDEALLRLARIDERRSRILEQRYFGGLSLE